MKAQDLLIGQQFTVDYCEDTMRKLVCLRVSPSGIFIEGQIKEDDVWKTKNTYIAGGTIVSVDENAPLMRVERGMGGNLYYIDDNAEAEETVQAERSFSQTHRRGRKSNPVIWPTIPFQISNLAKELRVSTTNLYLKLVAMEKEGKAKSTDLPRKEGQRGKPSKEWKVL